MNLKQPEGKKGNREVEELKNQLARALADYDNLVKRIEKEKEDFSKLANLQLVLKFLPIYDMLLQAQNHLQDTGLAITLKEFEEVLKDEGIEKISSGPGTDFNEEIHEAIESLAGGEKGKIAESALTGWKYKDGFIIRPEKVKVYKGEK